MKNVRLISAVFCLLARLCASSLAHDSIAIPRVSLMNEGVDLSDWLLIGPFNTTHGNDALDTDFLAKQGRLEHGFDAHEMNDYMKSVESMTLVRLISSSGVADFSKIYIDATSAVSSQAAVYAACCVQTPSDRKAWLLFGSDDGAKVWLNGRQIYVWRKNRSLNAFDDCVPLELKPGLNSLVIKVANVDSSWGLVARLEPDSISATSTVLAKNNDILLSPVIGETESFDLASRAFPEGSIFSTRILDYQTKKDVAKLDLKSGVTNRMPVLSDGLYDAEFLVGSRIHKQTFYRGAISTLLMDLTERCAKWQQNRKIADNLTTLLRRLEILDRLFKESPVSDSPTIRRQFLDDLEYKVIWTAVEITNILCHLENGEEAFQDQPGLHMRAFRSVVDDQRMNYRLFVPTRYDKDGPGLPLVVVMPTTFSARKPYLESRFVSMQREADQWAKVAERLGVGILWPGYRMCPYGNPADFTYLDEALQAVSSDYLIDTSRLTLYGICSGGLMASMEAMRNPNRYAGIAYQNAVFHRTKNRFDDTGEFNDLTAYKAWLSETDPVIPLAAIRNLPIWIIHDGMDPEHGPLSHSVDFIEQARAVGNRPRFDRWKDLMTDRFEIVEKQLVWLAQQQRALGNPLTAPAIDPHGPLSRVFSEPFILVEATGGTSEDKTANRKLSATFQDSWQRTCFGACRRIADVQLTPEIERKNHLVILGNAQTNVVWERMEHRLPISLEEDGVVVGGRAVKGRSLGVQAWFSNPEVPGKKVVLIGGLHPSETAFGTLELALDGWFDYAVWDNANGKPKLVVAGRYK